MRRLGISALGLAVLLLPTGAHASGLDLRVGAFFPSIPSGQANLLRDDISLYTVQKSDFTGVTGGAEFGFDLAPHVELGVHLDGYGRTIDSSYRNYTRDDGSEIFQTLKLETAPLGVTVRLVGGNRHSFQPYVGAGADLVFWHYEEIGDFIDFQDPALTVFPDQFRRDGVAPGFHVLAGLRVPINRDFSVTGEARYLWAHENDMGGDFAGNRLDLTGISATVGVHIRF